MCVIIYVPKTATISKEEISDAWRVNPDGAGFSIQDDNKVYFKRGFMKLEDFYNAIKNYIGVKNLLLHFRISTSKAVNKIQTHPYKKGNVMITEGTTTKPIICMNGIISGQKEYKDCNDTMSYIIDHKEAFANINQDILNIIEEASGAKWAVMKPDEVLLSSKFQEKNGKFYSNKNHLFYYNYKTFNKRLRQKKTLNNLIKSKKLRNSIKKDKILREDLDDFIECYCNGTTEFCSWCTKCLKTAKTLRDVKITLKENHYWEGYEEECDSLCCYSDKEYDLYGYDDIYNYSEQEKSDEEKIKDYLKFLEY